MPDATTAHSITEEDKAIETKMHKSIETNAGIYLDHSLPRGSGIIA